MSRRRAAEILVDSLYYGVVPTAKKWGITTRTVYGYRQRLQTDPVLSALFTEIRRNDERNWSADIGRALRIGIDRLIRYLDGIGVPTEREVREIRETVAILAEIATVREVLARDDEGDYQGGVVETTARALPPSSDRAN